MYSLIYKGLAFVFSFPLYFFSYCEERFFTQIIIKHLQKAKFFSILNYENGSLSDIYLLYIHRCFYGRAVF